MSQSIHLHAGDAAGLRGAAAMHEERQPEQPADVVITIAPAAGLRLPAQQGNDWLRIGAYALASGACVCASVAGGVGIGNLVAQGALRLHPALPLLAVGGIGAHSLKEAGSAGQTLADGYFPQADGKASPAARAACRHLAQGAFAAAVGGPLLAAGGLGAAASVASGALSVMLLVRIAGKFLGTAFMQELMGSARLVNDRGEPLVPGTPAFDSYLKDKRNLAFAAATVLVLAVHYAVISGAQRRMVAALAKAFQEEGIGAAQALNAASSLAVGVGAAEGIRKFLTEMASAAARQANGVYTSVTSPALPQLTGCASPAELFRRAVEGAKAWFLSPAQPAQQDGDPQAQLTNTFYVGSVAAFVGGLANGASVLFATACQAPMVGIDMVRNRISHAVARPAPDIEAPAARPQPIAHLQVPIANVQYVPVAGGSRVLAIHFDAPRRDSEDEGSQA